MKEKRPYRSSAEDFEKYLKGEMSVEDAHQLERASLEDAFEREALEGWESQPVEESAEDVSALRRALSSKNRSTFPIWRIAAAVAILLVGTFATYQLLQDTAQPLALEEAAEQKQSDRRPASGLDAETLAADQEEEVEMMAEEPAKLAETNDLIAEKESEPEGEPPPIEITPEEDVQIATESDVDQGFFAEAPVEEFADEDEALDQTLAESVVFEEKAEDDARELAAAKKAASLSKKQLAPSESTNLRPVTAAQPIAPDSVLIQGVVFDPYNRVVSDVDVIVEGTDLRTKSDVEGKYELKVPENMAAPVLRYEHEGFAAEERAVAVASDEFNVQLQSEKVEETSPASSTPDRQAAAGAVSRVTSNIEAQPLDGYTSYLEQITAKINDEHRDKNLKKGIVLIKATVTINGRLRDLQIVEGLNRRTDEVALQVIRDGPQWTPAIQNGEPIESEVQIPIAIR